MKKQITSVLLTAALLLAGCSTADDGSKTAETTSSPPASTTAVETEAIPSYTFGVPDELDYEDATFTFLTCPGQNDTDKYQWIQFSFDTEDGDLLNDALVKRNIAIEEYLNVNIEVNTSGHLTDTTAYQKAVRADEDSFQCGIWIDRFALAVAQQNMVYPLHNLADMYVDLEQPWWISDLNEELTIDNKLYFGASAYDMFIYGNLEMLLYNKDLATNLGLDNMYDMVRSGTWTVDVMYDYMKRGTSDLNGNTEQDPDDRWGMVYISNFLDYAMTGNNDAYFIEKDENDLPYFSAPGNERLMAICDALAKQLKDPNYAISFDKIPSEYQLGHVYENTVTMFAAGKALFTGSGACYLDNLREMEEEFGILPFPKMEEVEAGTPYKSWIFGILGYPVPSTIRDPEMASAVLECAAYYSYIDVVPTYLDTILQLKRARDDDSAEMLNMLANNLTIDLAHTYFLEATSPFYGDVFAKGTDVYASSLEKRTKAIEKSLEKTIEKFLALGE